MSPDSPVAHMKLVKIKNISPEKNNTLYPLPHLWRRFSNPTSTEPIPLTSVVSVATLTLEAQFVVLSLSMLKSISYKRVRRPKLGMECKTGRTSCGGRDLRNGDQELIFSQKLENQK